MMTALRGKMRTMGMLVLATVAFAVCDESPHVGDSLPDFHLRDTEGKTHSLTDYRGTKVLLFAFGSG
ncbi:MAG: redoxin domain-containing protein [Chitinivibrionales bacterium]|nr:redoxin domain-containing protein [Chitinivibrionales bacterium]MBD3395313.1 redoxin domain-containing protein [Chitinivibrionales bacterium]